MFLGGACVQHTHMGASGTLPCGSQGSKVLRLGSIGNKHPDQLSPLAQFRNIKREVFSFLGVQVANVKAQS